MLNTNLKYLKFIEIQRSWVCPETAACLAALKPLAQQGKIKKNDQVVLFNIGSFEKYLPDVRHILTLRYNTVIQDD